MNKWIILVTGPVIFGACSMKRQVDRSQSTATNVHTVEDRTFLLRDSVESALNRSLQIERRWLVELPQTGRRVRYEEHIRLGETTQSSAGTVQQAAVAAARAEQTEQHGHRMTDSAAETKDVGWWLWLLVGVGAWMAWRFLRIWLVK